MVSDEPSASGAGFAEEVADEDGGDNDEDVVGVEAEIGDSGEEEPFEWPVDVTGAAPPPKLDTAKFFVVEETDEECIVRLSLY